MMMMMMDQIDKFLLYRYILSYYPENSWKPWKPWKPWKWKPWEPLHTIEKETFLDLFTILGFFAQ